MPHHNGVLYRGAGRYRHQVTLQRVTETQSDTGAVTETWNPLATVRADIMPLDGTERFLAQAVTPVKTLNVAIRYYAGLTEKDRVLYGTRSLNILHILDVEERHREMVLLCEEVD
jgi:SPP1 family predicted phage head-tail adaptor